MFDDSRLPSQRVNILVLECEDTYIGQRLKLVALRIDFLVEWIIVVRFVWVFDLVGSSMVFTTARQRLLLLQRRRNSSTHAKRDKQ
jgi:hypothetical protein